MTDADLLKTLEEAVATYENTGDIEYLMAFLHRIIDNLRSSEGE